MSPLTLFVALHFNYDAQARAVFAHFMVENAAEWGPSDWHEDILLAQTAHIDTYAMNIRNGDESLITSIPLAFAAAEGLGFKLIFSFDNAGGGAWNHADVITYINDYASSSAYYHYLGQPFVSIFEGPDIAPDWVTIKSETDCFFMPDYSSLGAKRAVETGVVDGLLSWAAWPWGYQDMDTYIDASYRHYLGDLPYMMPISPWFYTNWSNTPSGGIGTYHGSVDFNRNFGTMEVEVLRSGASVATMSNGKAIVNYCTNNIESWNAWVGGWTWFCR